MENKGVTADGTNQSVFRVEGIACMDCAQKFEKAVNSLPGVTSASLNPITGRLTIQGSVDLQAIRRLGREEDYTIIGEPLRPATALAETWDDWEFRRAAASGICLSVAYLSEISIIASLPFLPFYLLAVLLGGWGNFAKASRSLMRMDFNMSVLMSVAVIGALSIGQYEEGATVAFLYAVSELMESWTMGKTRRSIRELMDVTPRTARVLRAGKDEEVPVEEIRIADILLVRPGEKIAMDGEIIKGESSINQAAITGESIPVEKSPGQSVFAGTLNTYGSLEVRVTRLVQDTTIAKIIHMVEEAQGKRAPAQAFVDKFAAIYTPIVLALAVCIILFPPLLMGFDWEPWIYRGLALLVVACPCALVVSTPVAIISAISTAAKHGVLIKGGIFLEQIGSTNAMAFDKTGTLTKGSPVVTDIVPLGSVTEDRLLEMAANMEVRSGHPLSLPIVKAAQKRSLPLIPVEDFTAISGRGAKATIDSQVIYIGNLRLFTELGVSTEAILHKLEFLQEQGKTVMILGGKNSIIGLIAVADEVREGSAAAIASLKKAGIRHTIMLTGDNSATASAMAKTVGVDEFRAELLPQDKVTAIQELLRIYGKVVMIGDGINDAPALAQSTVGIAMGGAGTDTAIETADITLMGDDLDKLPFLVRLSRETLKIIRQNIAFSVLIKTVAILAVFPGWLTLWLAILSDMGASLLVTLNSLRILRVKEKD